MNQEELLDLYLEKLQEEQSSVIKALKASMVYLEGEMQGY